MPDITKYLLNEENIQKFASDIFSKFNIRLADKISSEYDPTNESVAMTGKAVSTAVSELTNRINGLTHLNIEIIVGSIDSVTEPSEDILYFQKDNENDKTWSLYVYKNDLDDHWILVGDTSIDLVNYWKKTDTEEIKKTLRIVEHDVISPDQISTIFNSLFEDPNEKYFVYADTSDDGYAIDGLTDEGKLQTELIIPNTHKGKPVTKINTDSGFSDNNVVESIVIGDNITALDKRAIKNMPKLKKITIPGSITYVDFGTTPMLTSITYNSIEYTELKELKAALSANGINVDDDIFVDTGIYANYLKTLYNFTEDENNAYISGLSDEGKKISELRIPVLYNGKPVTKIANNAFENATNIESMVIPEGITEIGQAAFAGCNNLKDISLPLTLKTIGNSAFSRLNNINYGGNSLSDVTYYGSDDDFYNINIGTNNYALICSSGKFDSEKIKSIVSKEFREELSETKTTEIDIDYSGNHGNDCEEFYFTLSNNVSTSSDEEYLLNFSDISVNFDPFDSGFVKVHTEVTAHSAYIEFNALRDYNPQDLGDSTTCTMRRTITLTLELYGYNITFNYPVHITWYKPD